MDRWPHSVRSYTPAEVAKYVVDAEWQKCRLSMKGIPTTEKLEILNKYRSDRLAYSSGHPDIPNSRHLADHGVLEREHQVQIDNYINALKRGGQLRMDLTVQR